jgi:transposase-like protein
MATRQQFELSTAERRKRVFSTEFKIKKVREIEQKKTTIAEVSRAYQVRQSAIHLWMNKYSSSYKKSVRLIVEMESDTKQLLDLKAKIAELERIVGQKQLIIEFQSKMIELAEETYGVDIKKKSESKSSSTTGNTESSSEQV